MARVALRTLTREIEDQIEHGQIDQAIANCRHILTFFPKHIDTYRLLGKAYMEGQHFGDAADVFQRVLSSVPEDFIAHLGMSIIQEDEGNLDDAIWHMERAFEMQPSNSAVQGELRRLYGRRDGLEPPKIRLTRGALARMYVKGGLYPQAISELRTALAEESQRPDLLTLLAKAYYYSGQKVEAADTCSNLLGRLPYSLEGNRLLAEILSGSERANEAETYRQRVQALDPYSAHVSPSTPNPENVPDGAVTLERLDWIPGKTSGEAPSQPEWAASLGVKVAGLTPEKESLPDWLSTIASKDQEAAPSGEGEPGRASPTQESEEAIEKPGIPGAASGAADSLGGAASGAAGLGAAGLAAIGFGVAGLAASGQKDDEEIPDWMREAGWEASTGAGNEGSTSSSHEEPWGDKQAQGDELAPAEIPEWLRSMAPPGGLEAEASPETAPGQELPVVGNELPAEVVPGTSSPDDVLPWLSENPPGASDSVVTWLENMETEPGEPENLASESSDSSGSEIPEWLRDIEEGSQESTELSSATAENQPDLPEWLAGSQAESDAEEIPDWLKSMAETTETGAGLSDEIILSPADTGVEQPEEPVEWQPEIAEETSVVSGTGEILDSGPLSGPVDQQPEAETGLETGEEPTPEQSVRAAEVAAFAWLAGLEERQGEEDSLASAEESPEAPPEWAQQPVGAVIDQPSFAEGDLPVDGFPPESPEVTSEGGAELPDWLQASPDQNEAAGLVEGEGESVEEQQLAASELPDWLRGLGTEEGEGEQKEALGWEEEAEASVQPAEPDRLLEWLNEAESPTSEVEAPKGLASLEEPPVSEEDTKPTRISKASEVPIPAALVGFIAGAEAFTHHKEEEGEGPEEAQVEPQTQGVSQAETVEQPEVVAESLAETSEEGLPAIEEARPIVTDEEAGVEETGLVAEALVPGIAAAAILTDRTGAEPPEKASAGEEIPESAIEQPIESGVLPDWLRELEEEPEVAWEPSTWAAEEAGEPAPEELTSEAQSIEGDEAFAWLEGLAARQGAEEGLIISPEERQEEPPEWVAEEATEPMEGKIFQSENEPEAVIPVEPHGEMPEEPVSGEGPAESVSMPEEETGGFLESAAQAAVAFTAIKALAETPEESSSKEAEEIQPPIEPVPTSEPIQKETPAEEIPELPSWLAGYEEASVEEELTWTPPAAFSEEQALQGGGEGETWEPERLDINQASLVELERVPGIGFVRAQALLAYREAHGPFTSLDDLQNIPGFDPDSLAQMQERVKVLAPAGMDETPVDDHQLALIQARNALAQGDKDNSLACYSILIKKRALLPDVIQDLHEALYRFPVEVSIWQALGDAYARNEQLQEAIDAYTKAEDLLR